MASHDLMVVFGQYRRNDDGTLWMCIGAATEAVKPGGYMTFVPWLNGERRNYRKASTYTVRDAHALFDYVTRKDV